ncbi:type IV pilus modification PilV family protein [Vibrio nitrifigilis]|uniref:Prepilin-type N-terminal cleavage/methylation domain-containing protein n=1 Tax=Vibrio nitrifigilis TaxID=2789781 RepID=A0ABS0G9E0_9VIBR|nr:hypothetical protein [Vibrio nitrifigilis]MBF8998986.1 hypothetical protein [Vibrio nitrifigilis]
MNIKRHQGIGLIEVLVTMLLISLSVLGLMKSHLYLLQHQDAALVKQQAYQVAHEQLSEWQRQSYSETWFDERLHSGHSVVDTYTMNWRVSPLMNAHLKLVELKVSWNDKQFGEQSIEIKTIYQRGVLPIYRPTLSQDG